LTQKKPSLKLVFIIIIIIIRVILNCTGLNLNVVVVIYHICGLCPLLFYFGQLRHFSIK